MRKILCVFMLALAISGTAYSAGSVEMKRMSAFLSSFTEAKLFNFDLKSDFYEGENEQAGGTKLHLGMPANVAELVNFGIVHNLLNNRDIIEDCEDPECEAGSMKIAGKFVAEMVRKYFGFDLDAMDLSYITENPSVVFSYDGRFYHFDEESFSEPGEDVVYRAKVQDIDEGGRYISASGYIYDKKRPSHKTGTFSAFVRPNGKSWMIISMSTNWRKR